MPHMGSDLQVRPDHQQSASEIDEIAFRRSEYLERHGGQSACPDRARQTEPI